MLPGMASNPLQPEHERYARVESMRLGGVPYNLVVDARITAVKAGIEISTDKISAHFLAGGNVVPTIQAIIAAQKASNKTSATLLLKLGEWLCAATKAGE